MSSPYNHNQYNRNRNNRRNNNNNNNPYQIHLVPSPAQNPNNNNNNRNWSAPPDRNSRNSDTIDPTTENWRENYSANMNNNEQITQEPTNAQLQQQILELTRQLQRVTAENQVLANQIPNLMQQNNLQQRFNANLNVNNESNTNTTNNNLFVNVVTTLPNLPEPMSLDSESKEAQREIARQNDQEKRFNDAVMRFNDKNLPSTLLSPDEFNHIDNYLDYLKSKAIACFPPIAQDFAPQSVQAAIVEAFIYKSLNKQKDRLFNAGPIDKNRISTWTLKNLVSAVMLIQNKAILDEDSRIREWKVTRRTTGELYEDCLYKILTAGKRVGFRVEGDKENPLTQYEASQIFNIVFKKLNMNDNSRQELFKLSTRDKLIWPGIPQFLEEATRLDRLGMSRFVQNTFEIGETATGNISQEQLENLIRNSRYINNRPRALVERNNNGRVIEVNNVNATSPDVNKNRKCFACGEYGHIAASCHTRASPNTENLNNVLSDVIEEINGNDDDKDIPKEDQDAEAESDLQIMLNSLSNHQTDQVLQTQAASSTDSLSNILNVNAGVYSPNGKGNTTSNNTTNNNGNNQIRPLWSKSPGLRFKFTPKAKSQSGKGSKYVKIRFNDAGEMECYSVEADANDNAETEANPTPSDNNGGVMIQMLQNELDIEDLGEF